MVALQKVLIVDDSLSSRLVLRRMLERQNISADMAASAKEALAFLTQHKPDAIFMDHEMPEMNGLQVLEILKSNPATEAIPVAMFTTREEAEYAKTALQCGAIGVLPKPFNDAALFSIIQALQTSARVRSANTSELTAANDEGSGSDASPFDVKTLEVMIRSIVHDVINEQVLPALNKQVNVLKEEISTDQQDILTNRILNMELPADQIESIALSAVLPKLEETTQLLSNLKIQNVEDISENTLLKAKTLIQSTQQNQMGIIDSRFNALEKEFDSRFGEVRKWLAEQQSPTHFEMMNRARPPYSAGRDSQKAEIIDVIPNKWSSDEYTIPRGKISSVNNNHRKLKQVYVFTGVTTIIIGLVITGLFLLSNLFQVYQDFKP
jgi:CheY-like chemotaxis protein